MIVDDRLDPDGCWARDDDAPRWDEPARWVRVEAAYTWACGRPAKSDPLGLCPAHRARFDHDVFAAAS